MRAPECRALRRCASHRSSRLTLRNQAMQDEQQERVPFRAAGAAFTAPAHPRERREPLPWHQPKPAVDDPDALGRVQAIMASPSYREADQDVAFLDRPESRGVRLQIDYLKSELTLEQHGVEHTIVVF